MTSFLHTHIFASASPSAPPETLLLPVSPLLSRTNPLWATPFCSYSSNNGTLLRKAPAPNPSALRVASQLWPAGLCPLAPQLLPRHGTKEVLRGEWRSSSIRHTNSGMDASPVLLTFSFWHLHAALSSTGHFPAWPLVHNAHRDQLLHSGCQRGPGPRAISSDVTAWSCKAVSTSQMRKPRLRGQVTTGEWPSRMHPPVPSSLSNQLRPLLCSSEAIQAKVTVTSTLPCPKVSPPRLLPHCWGLTQMMPPHLDGTFSAGFLDTPPTPTSWRFCRSPPFSPPLLSNSAHSSQRHLTWDPGPRGHE